MHAQTKRKYLLQRLFTPREKTHPRPIDGDVNGVNQECFRCFTWLLEFDAKYDCVLRVASCNFCIGF